MSNPFAFAIIVHPNPLPKGKRKTPGKWLSRDGLSANRIHAECWPDKETAQKVATGTAELNPDWTFTVRKFGKG